MIYDYIIIGAGPAGCFCATELAQKKKKVLILEKEPKGYRKVCGDGISAICTEVLEMMKFPIARFEEAGAVRVHDFYYYDPEHVFHEQHQDTRCGYGLRRDLTDQVFRSYASEDYQVPILYEYKAEHIVSEKGVYHVGDYLAKQVILAAGAMGTVMLNGKSVLNRKEIEMRPIGLSTVLRGRPWKKPYFLFDYGKQFKGTYGWIFTQGSNCYNVGVWMKEDKKRIRDELDLFLQTRVKDWIGLDYEVVEPVRGAVLGCGEPMEQKAGIYLAGDAGNTCNPNTGEGISKAIISAKRLIQQLEG